MVAVGRNGERPLGQVAKDFGICERCRQQLLRVADHHDGIDQTAEQAKLRQAQKRIRLLEQENETLLQAAAHRSRAHRSDPRFKLHERLSVEEPDPRFWP